MADPHVSTSITRARAGTCSPAATPITADEVGAVEDWLAELGIRLCGLMGVDGYRALLTRALVGCKRGTGHNQVCPTAPMCMAG